MRKKGISILGSTGSIGTNTLEVVRMHPERFKVVSLAAGNNIALLKKQVEEFRPSFVSVSDSEAASALRGSLTFPVEVGFGIEGATRAAAFDGVEMCVSAISGAAGLLPTMSAIKAGVDIALANKETLVLAGPLVMEEVGKRKVKFLPVDSEHSAVYQSIAGHRPEDIKRLILTASGGPFLRTPMEEFAGITPEAALKHPRWKMGRKISIDSATLVNKGLEVIEARWLFDIPADKISVVIHPQSIVHSMVEYIDGSIMAQMGNPDMKGPIAYALSWPERIDSGTPQLGFSGLSLDFLDPEPERFPCLSLAYEALRRGGTAPAVLNAADEVAVALFLEGSLPFTGISAVIREVMERYCHGEIRAIEDVLEADRAARAAASSLAGRMR
ncbi:1-deoxy-D-xylulose-5-phosphate reductoisomerase [uncultured bacterium]|nr:1-deoxy-D-xylulose-5-phosphate reductoisomerase [uncultured bacterium]